MRRTISVILLAALSSCLSETYTVPDFSIGDIVQDPEVPLVIHYPASWCNEVNCNTDEVDVAVDRANVLYGGEVKFFVDDVVMSDHDAYIDTPRGELHLVDVEGPTVNVFLVDKVARDGNILAGRANRDDIDGDGNTCAITVIVDLDYDSHVLAHELGHILGLGHDNSAENVMNTRYSPDNSILKPDQLNTAHNTALKMLRVCS